MSLDKISGDRRLDRRYDLELRLEFVCTGRPVLRMGCGETIELSRSGVRFWTDDPPDIGVDIELRIAWPFLLQNVCPLQLIVKGRVLSASERGTVVQTRSYEFQTCGEKSFSGAFRNPSTSLVA
jgi:hypothetical protein